MSAAFDGARRVEMVCFPIPSGAKQSIQLCQIIEKPLRQEAREIFLEYGSCGDERNTLWSLVPAAKLKTFSKRSQQQLALTGENFIRCAGT